MFTVSKWFNWLKWIKLILWLYYSLDGHNSSQILRQIIWRETITLFFTNPHIIAACEGSGDPARYFSTPFELGRLDSSNWSDMSKKRREPISLVVPKRCSKAELVTASNWAIPVTTTCGFNFLISSIIKSDWRGASITVIASILGLVVSVSYRQCQRENKYSHKVQRKSFIS